MRSLISVSVFLILWPQFEASAQSGTESTSLARAALTATDANVQAIGNTRSGPYLVDIGSFSEAFRRVGADDLSTSTFLAGLDIPTKAADERAAISCVAKGTVPSCEIANGGIFVMADSALFSLPDAEVVIRYFFSVLRGPHRNQATLAFVKLRLTFHRTESGWILVRSSIEQRS